MSTGMLLILCVYIGISVWIVSWMDGSG